MVGDRKRGDGESHFCHSQKFLKDKIFIYFSLDLLRPLTSYHIQTRKSTLFQSPQKRCHFVSALQQHSPSAAAPFFSLRHSLRRWCRQEDGTGFTSIVQILQMGIR